jgi:hypothetical protein
MYIWVILSTFVVTIASFMIPLRSDIKQLEGERQAEPVIVSFITQHEAAVKYVKANICRDGDGLRLRKFTDGGESDLYDKIVVYFSKANILSVSKRLKDADGVNYLGMWEQTGGVVSALYCLDNSQSLTRCAGYQFPISSFYVVSYATLDTKWCRWANSECNVSNDFRSAMLNYSGGRNFGYKEASGGGKLIRLGKGVELIPGAITDPQSPEVSNEPSNVFSKKCAGSIQPCLVQFEEITNVENCTPSAT